jgi:hypothetical protein
VSERVVWRPSRRTLLTAGIWLVVTVALLYLCVGLRVLSMFFPSLGAAALAAYYGVVATRGRTELTDDGLRNTLWRTKTLPWSRVSSLFVQGSTFGDVVTVGGAGPAFRLAAPRTGPIGRDPRFEERLAELETRYRSAGGDHWRRRTHPAWTFGCLLMPLLALVAWLLFAIDKPWRDAWWPGVHLASAAPAPCTVLDDAMLRHALGAGHSAGEPTDEPVGSGCEWNRAGDTDGDLTIAYHLTDTGTTDSVQQATDALHLFAGREHTPVPGLGDEAYLVHQGRTVRVWVRTVNMVTQVDYDSDPAVAIELARRATAAIRID